MFARFDARLPEIRKGEFRAGHVLKQTEVKSIEIIYWQLRQAVMLYSCFEKKSCHSCDSSLFFKPGPKL
jgi:hypothetical protein